VNVESLAVKPESAVDLALSLSLSLSLKWVSFGAASLKQDYGEIFNLWP